MKHNKEDDFIHFLTNDYINLKNEIEFEKYDKIELDLGCGKGSFSTQLAAKYPERLIMSADVMVGRLRKLRKRIVRENIDNIELLRVEANALIYKMYNDNTIDRIHVLCPDPWPKDRHRRNRLMSSQFLGQLHRVLKKDGVFHFGSDDEPYYAHAIKILEKSGIFKRDDSYLSDISDIKTDFEVRWNSQGKEVHHSTWLVING